MAATAASLLAYLNTRADINYYIQQQQFWSAKYTANEAKLAEQVKLEDKWMSEYDKAFEEGRSTELKYNACGLSGTIGKEQIAASEAIAEAYAYTKVDEYDEELSLELADLDIEYDTMKNMYDTLIETMRAQEESQKTLTSENAQDTGMLNAG